MVEPYELTVADAVSQFHSRQLTPVELMESLLARVRTLEPDLKVWATLDEDAARAAARSSQRELEVGNGVGPLHGVPLGVKDIFYTEGVRTAAGSPIYADFVPSFDATSVARLRRAGAIVMGKTVTTEFAYADPSPTRNPWDPAHTPGGSSSGSAVGVATRMFPAALGSQTAGSVLRPASYNGVVGLKPSYGRISAYGVMPLAPSLDTIGVLTRSVEDAAILLGVMAGGDDNDPASAPEPVPDYQRSLANGGAPRIGLLRQLFVDRADPEVLHHLEDVVQKLADAGARVEEVQVALDLESLLAAHMVVMRVEAAAVHRSDFRERRSAYGPKIGDFIEAGLSTPRAMYTAALNARRQFRTDAERALEGFDVLLTPTATTPAPRDLSTTGDPTFQIPWTSSGMPSMTLPSGTSEAGLPLGTQIASAPFQEGKLLSAALWCERVLGFRQVPPDKP